MPAQIGVGMLMPLMALVYLTLFACAAAVGWMVVRYDLYDKEPWYIALAAIALGVGVMALMGPLEMFTYHLVGERGTFSVRLALIAATHEELGKLAVVVFIALTLRGVFNDPADGLIYGSLAGLGAAVEESVGVLRATSAGFDTGLLPGAEVVRLVGHAIMGGITGYGVGLFVGRHPTRWIVLLGCVLASIMLHFLWDLVAIEQTQALSWHSLAAVVIMIAGLALFGWLVTRAAALAHAHFKPAHHRRLFGWPLSKVFRA